MTSIKFFKNLATLGPIGYYKGSGTLASFFGLILVFLIDLFSPNCFYSLLFILVATFLSFKLLKYVTSEFDYQDPPEIVIDEVIGVLYAFWGLRLNVGVLFWCFLFFRFFDITKIMGIGYLEKNFSNPVSIILDDIGAGLLTNLLIRILGNI